MNKKIKSYYIVSASTTDELAVRVNKLVSEGWGWEPHGSAFVTNGKLYAQPMIQVEYLPSEKYLRP